jgi:hypothetical protein
MVNTARAQALTEAVTLHAASFNDTQPGAARADVIATAEAFYRFLTGPASLSVAFGPIVKQQTHAETGKAGTAMAQIHDDEEFDLELSAADAKGAEVLDRAGDTTDDATWTSSDEAVFTYLVDPANPRKATVVAGLPGSAVGTVNLGTITITHAVDVVAADVATVNLTEGDARKQTP